MAADLMPLLVGFAFRAALVLAFAWGLTAAMRRASASARHLVWTCALAAAMLTPVTALVTPPWRVESPVSLAPASPAPPATAVLLPTQSASTQLRAVPASAPRASVDAGDVALLVWACGTIAVLFYLLVGYISFWRLRRRAVAANADAADDVQALAEALNIGQPIAVAHSSVATTPMVSGIWRPFIVMPRGAAAWPEDRRHVVLLHELAHIKRRDCLTQLLAQVMCAAYWFNPLVWIAARRLRVERERACDDFVLTAGTRGAAYANHLLEITQSTPSARFSPVTATAIAMARRSQLEGRLMAILDPTTRRSSASYTRFAAAALVATISIPAAAVQLVTRSATPIADVGFETIAKLEPRRAASASSVEAGPAPQAPARPVPDDRVHATLNRTLLEFADDGDVDGVNAMLAAGADVNAQVPGDGSPLIAAAGEGHVDVVRVLLDRGADPNLIVPGDGSPLIAAAGEGDVDVVRVLLDRGADPNLIVPGDGTALIAAAADGHVDVMTLLLDRGANVDLVAEGDETALIQASGDGHLDAVKLLVSRGADVNLGVRVPVQDSIWFRGRRAREAIPGGTELRTPLSEARGDGHVDVVMFLISAGARD